MKQHLSKVAQERNDEWGAEVLGRLELINDLVASESVYHEHCKINFDNETLRQKSPCVKSEKGVKDEVFRELHSWLDNELDHGIITLESVYKKYKSLNKSASSEYSAKV